MPDEKTDPVEPGHPGFGYWLARAIVWLRFLIIPAWIVAAVLASTGLPSIFNAETSSLGNLLPRSSKPLEVEERALKTFGLPLLSRTIVVASEPAGIHAAAERRGRPLHRHRRQRQGREHPPRRPPARRARGPLLPPAGHDPRHLPLHRPGTERIRIGRRGARLRHRAEAGDRRAPGRGDRCASRQRRRNEHRQRIHPLGGARDGAAGRRDPRLPLPLRRDPPARAGERRDRLPAGRPRPRLDGRPISASKSRRRSSRSSSRCSSAPSPTTSSSSSPTTAVACSTGEALAPGGRPRRPPSCCR